MRLRVAQSPPYLDSLRLLEMLTRCTLSRLNGPGAVALVIVRTWQESSIRDDKDYMERASLHNERYYDTICLIDRISSSRRIMAPRMAIGGSRIFAL